MAVAMVFEVLGGTQEQYDAMMKEIGQSYPGRRLHVAGLIQGGWQVVDVGL